MAPGLGVSWQSHHREASHARSGAKGAMPGGGEHKITLTPSSGYIGQLGGHSLDGVSAKIEVVVRDQGEAILHGDVEVSVNPVALVSLAILVKRNLLIDPHGVDQL